MNQRIHNSAMQAEYYKNYNRILNVNELWFLRN